MKAPKLVKTKKANSRSQSQLQVGKCNFIEIPTGLLSILQFAMRDPWEFWFDIHCILPMNYEKLGGNFEAINSAQVIYLRVIFKICKKNFWL